MKSESHLALFAKFWRPGKVKTRLASTLGNQLACQVYFEFLSHLLNQLGQVGDRRTVVFHPAGFQQEFSRVCGEPWALEPQATGDLGEKLSQFFSQSLESKEIRATDTTTRKVIVIGSDCPRLDRPLIDEAFEVLDRQPVVLGPSTDGGYYLIGMRKNCPEIFQGISWSTPTVLAETIARLKDLNVGYELLPEMTDIDEVKDLTKLMKELAFESSGAETALLKRLTEIMANSDFASNPCDKVDQSEIQP